MDMSLIYVAEDRPTLLEDEAARTKTERLLDSLAPEPARGAFWLMLHDVVEQSYAQLLDGDLASPSAVIPTFESFQSPEGLVASDDDLTWLADTFKFHPLTIEDCRIATERPKLEEYDGYCSG